MNESDPNPSATPNPPISSSAGNLPQDTMLMRGAFDPPATPGTLGRLDRFEILRLLGEGGMGQVYLAREPLTDTQVAIKIMKPHLAVDPQSVHRFLTEARHMYRLSHPWILRVLEVSNRKEGPYYVMSYIAGGSLLAQYQPGQPLPEERVLAIARQVAGALAHAHAHGIIHRDLKPGNVLLDKDGNAFLTDFGLVRTVFNDSMIDASASHLEGTAPYMSPAVARGEAEDTRCDIYAFGALLYELLTGQPPYTGRTPQLILDQVIKGPPPPIRSLNPKVNPALVRIAEGCMARELRDRYATMADVVSDIDRSVKGALPLGQQQQRRRRPGIAAMVIGGLVVAGVIGVTAYLSAPGKPFKSAAREDTRPPESQGSDSLVGRTAPRAENQANDSAKQAPGAATDEHDFSCTATNGTITIVKYTGEGGAVNIPATISGLPVTIIKNEAFLNCSNVTSVTLPNSVVVIGNGAFKNCAELGKITIDQRVTVIGKEAFSGCSKLTNITIPVGVTGLNWGRGSQFNGCSSLTSIWVDVLNPALASSKDGVVFNKEMTSLLGYPCGRSGSYVIPNRITSIGPGAFFSCPKLTGVTIPNGVTHIGDWAFCGCSSLTGVTIPASITNVWWGPTFHRCSSLASIMVDVLNPAFASKDGVVFDKEMTTLIRYPPGKTGSYVVPTGVTRIGSGAYGGCRNLSSITIPNSITEVDGWAFWECSEATNLTIGAGITHIGSGVFGECASLTSVSIPNNVTSIETQGFNRCANLRNVAVPPSVTNIGVCAFGTCLSLTSMVFRGNAPGLGARPFDGANNLTIYYLPGTKGWGKEFGGRPTAVWTDATNTADSPAATIEHDFSCTATNGAVTIVKYTGDGGAVIIPATISGLPVTTIKNEAFLNCANVTSVAIPNSVTNIGNDVFTKCTGLAKVTIGKNVASIGGHAFLNCANLTTVTIPASVTGIDWDSTFSGCSNLSSIAVDILNSTYTSSKDGVVFNKEKTALVYYPKGKAGSYMVPNYVAGIEWAAFAGCGKLTGLTIPATVNSIGGYAFSYCSQLNAIMVDAANPVYSTSADGIVFNKAKTCLVSYPSGRAGSYVIPSTVTQIEPGAFKGSVRLTSVTIPQGVTTLERGTFANCTGLTNVTIPASVTRLGGNFWEGGVFEGCFSLTSVTIPYGVISLEVRAFKNCTSLSNVTIPNGITSIGGDWWEGGAFFGCSNLTSVTIPPSVTNIDIGAFSGCTSLTNATIPESVANIGACAFQKCPNLTSVYFKGNAPEGGSDARVFAGDDKATIYYLPGTKGWGKEFGGRPTALSPEPMDLGLFTCTITKGTITITKYKGPGGAVTIPETISGIPVTSIGDGAFQDCTNLTSVTIPNSVTSIGSLAFCDCSSLTSIKVAAANPTYCSSIDGVLFNKDKTGLFCCPGGKSGKYTIPNSVIGIGEFAFKECAKLKSVTIPNSVTSIGGWAFWGCEKLTSLTIPASVTSFASFSFDECRRMTALVVDPANPAFSSVDGVVFNKDKTRLVRYPSGKVGGYVISACVTQIASSAFESSSGLTSVTIPNGVMTLEFSTFRDCTNLTNVTIPSSVVSIGSDTFRGCVRLTGATISDSCTSIGIHAFDGCAGLTSMTIPKSVANIGDCAFQGCTSLSGVYFKGDAPNLGGYAFYGTTKATIYYLPGTTGWGKEFGGRPVVMRNVGK